MKHSARNRIIGWALVGIQFALIAAVVLLPRDADWGWGSWADWIGWGLVVLAVVLGLWGSRHLGAGLTPLPLPNGETRLVTRGPYRLVRHPLYTAVILFAAGIALQSRSRPVIAVAAALAVFLAFKARWEETHLRALFPDYGAYARSTPMFIPVRRRDGAGSPGSGAPRGR